MATFTDEDKRILETLWKAHQGLLNTREDLSPWQEALSRDDSIYAMRSVIASQIVEGFSGSWAASYSAEFGGRIQAPGSAPNPFEGVDPSVGASSQWHTSRIGQRGAPELNFPPFQAYTNAKNTGLVGWPISFEIVGPTLKSPFCDWIWQVTQGGGGFAGGDLFEMDVSYSGGATSASTILEAYNVPDFFLGGATEPNGGLFLVVIDDGTAAGALPTGYTSLPPNARYADTARTEIFRIVAANTNQFEIHPNKPLSRYFQLPPAGVRFIRAIMVIAPYATRLAAIPTGKPGQSTTGKGGREQTFVTVLPERAASSDLFPPYNGPGVVLGPWLIGGFTEDAAPGSTGAVGSPDLYGGKVPLPIPTPRGISSGILEKGAAALPSVDVGLWRVAVADTTPFTAGATVVKVFQTNRDTDIEAPTYGRMGSCLGFFMVYDVIPATAVVLGRVPEVFIETMKIYFGPGPYIRSGAITQNISVAMVLYDTISSLWQGAFDLDKVQASRLRPLLDPKWVERTTKQISNALTPPPLPGSGAGRPDRAIFDTEEGSGAPVLQVANPGNLQDLGFRMVLFPARPSITGDAIPDFRKPIDTREVVIDPSVSEPQHIDIDYATGTVTLSHPPPNLANIAIGEGDIIPNGIWGLSSNNPRGEVVLFAACVPASMELGTGVRLRTRETNADPARDIFNGKVHAFVDMTNTAWDVGVAPYIGISPFTLQRDIVLDRLWEGPPTGVIEILSGSLESPSYGLWAYNNIEGVTTPLGGPVTALRGLSCLSSASDPSALSLGEIRTVVLRRDVVYADQSATPQDALPGGRWYTDNAYGGAKRSDTIIVEGADVEVLPDGAPIVRLQPSQYFDRPWGQILPSKLPVGVGFPTNPTPANNYFAEEGILAGLAYEVPLGHPNAPEPGGIYGAVGGQRLEFRADIAAPSWHGIISRFTGLTPSGILSAGEGWRYTATFGIEYLLPTQEANFFLGFVQFEGIPPATPSVGLLTSGPGGLPADYSVFAIWHEGSVSPALNVWSRAAGGADVITPLGNVTVDAVSALNYGPFTVVMECTRVPLFTFASSISLKTTLYDAQGRIIGRAHHTNTETTPKLGPGLIFCQGVRLTAASPSVSLFMYGSSIVALEPTMRTRT